MKAALLAQLRERAARAPDAARRALAIGAHVVGSIETPLAAALLDARLPVRDDGRLVIDDTDADAALERIAHWLHDHGHAGRRRDELLPVNDEQHRTLARVERGVVRPLGIATYAVHMVGFADDGRQWLQQRAFDKATDPGLWDTLMGGLIAAGETVAGALERETWEEAGLRIGDLDPIREAGIVTVRRPVAHSGTGGYMVEHIHAMHCRVPSHLTPVNRDGEVLRFERFDSAEIEHRIALEQVTLEAALVMARVNEAGGA